MTPRDNLLLAPLPHAEYQRFLPHLQLVSLMRGQVLFEGGETLQWVHYPVGAVVSLLIDTPSGDKQEVLLMGKHCMVGLGAMSGASPYQAKVLSAGLAYRMPLAQLRQVRSDCPQYLHEAAWAVQRSLGTMGLNVLCCRRHHLPQQLRRWLLSHLDLCDENTIHVTHDELAERLGYRRELVTQSLGQLARAGALALQRGSIQVLQRQTLLEGVCECYAQQSQWFRPANTSPRSG